jgi:hypothetical protein
VAALRRADPPSKEFYRLRINQETEKAAKVQKGCGTINRLKLVRSYNEERYLILFLPSPMVIILFNEKCCLNDTNCPMKTVNLKFELKFNLSSGYICLIIIVILLK